MDPLLRSRLRTIIHIPPGNIAPRHHQEVNDLLRRFPSLYYDRDLCLPRGKSYFVGLPNCQGINVSPTLMHWLIRTGASIGYIEQTYGLILKITLEDILVACLEGADDVALFFFKEYLRTSESYRMEAFELVLRAIVGPWTQLKTETKCQLLDLMPDVDHQFEATGYRAINDIFNYFKIMDLGVLRNLVENVRNIDSLVLRPSDWGPDIATESIVSRIPSPLVSGSAIMKRELSTLFRKANKITLDIEHPTAFIDVFLKRVAPELSETLKQLDLRIPDRFFDHDIARSYFSDGMGCLTSLERLTLSLMCMSSDDATWKAIWNPIRSLMNLQILELTNACLNGALVKSLGSIVMPSKVIIHFEERYNMLKLYPELVSAIEAASIQDLTLHFGGAHGYVLYHIGSSSEEATIFVAKLLRIRSLRRLTLSGIYPTFDNCKITDALKNNTTLGELIWPATLKARDAATLFHILKGEHDEVTNTANMTLTYFNFSLFEPDTCPCILAAIRDLLDFNAQGRQTIEASFNACRPSQFLPLLQCLHHNLLDDLRYYILRKNPTTWLSTTPLSPIPHGSTKKLSYCGGNRNKHRRIS